MPPRARKIQLSDEVRTAFKRRLNHVKAVADRAEQDFHVEVYLMWQSGLTFDEIAETLGTRSSTVSDWKRKGEEVYNRRESARDQQSGGDPDRPSELISHG